MTNKKKRDDDLHIQRDQLDAVLDEASHLMAKQGHDEEVSKAALDAIAEETGFSKDVLAQAQHRLAARKQRNRALAAIGGLGALGVLVLAWPTIFPGPKLDPVAAALKAEGLRQEAVRLRYEEDFRGAVRQAEAAAKLAPTNLLVLNELGLANEYAGNTTRAQEVYRQAIALGPTQHDASYAHYNLGCMLAKTALKQQAEQELKAAAACWPDFAPAHNALGRLYEKLNQPADALGAYEATVKADATYRAGTRNQQALQARLKHAGELLARARAQLAANQPGPALDLAHQAVNKFGRNRLTQREMGLDYDGDPKIVRKLADGFFEEAEHLHDKGHSHHEVKAFREAIEHAMSAVEVDPDDFQAAFLLAMLYEDLGRHTEAVDAYQLAIEMGGPEKDQARAWSYLGDTYVKLNNPTDAVDAYSQAIKVRPGEYYAYDRLGTLYKQQGKLDEARGIIQAGLARSPNDTHLRADLTALGR
jgi:tetratricopeptide (TPR) repeat protein